MKEKSAFKINNAALEQFRQKVQHLKKTNPELNPNDAYERLRSEMREEVRRFSFQEHREIIANRIDEIDRKYPNIPSGKALAMIERALPPEPFLIAQVFVKT